MKKTKKKHKKNIGKTKKKKFKIIYEKTRKNKLEISRINDFYEENKKNIIEKPKTYPIIPKHLNIQKCILNIETREDEIKLLDELIQIDKDFLKFLFKGLVNSFSGIENENLIKISHVTKYSTQFSLYNALNSKIKDGYNSMVFKEFLINYFKHEKDINNTHKILIFSQTLFFSTNFLCNLTKNIIGIDFLWNKINSFLY